jgi:2-dehydro-3-deoxyphosphooctonate aldolase (KDO 8-P synthase)
LQEEIVVSCVIVAAAAVCQAMDMEFATATSPFFDALRTAEPFFVMAGPNVIESEEHALKMARQIKSVTDELGLQLVFKSSFDKANRTSSASFRGPGLEYGLKVLQQVKTTYGLPIVTDVHEAYQVSSISSLPHHKSIVF